ncbi:unnamed protein product, partial [Didymodactylos carnosus]
VRRFAVPFPDMNRFLSTNTKLHHSTDKSHPHDYHAYLCSISKDSEEVTNFINVFTEEHGEAPSFNIFESCEKVIKKRAVNSDSKEQTKAEDSSENSTTNQLEELTQFCHNQPSTVNKRWGPKPLDGPISIDFISQMLEARKVKSYPYSNQLDPYVV